MYSRRADAAPIDEIGDRRRRSLCVSHLLLAMTASRPIRATPRSRPGRQSRAEEVARRRRRLRIGEVCKQVVAEPQSAVSLVEPCTASSTFGELAEATVGSASGQRTAAPMRSRDRPIAGERITSLVHLPVQLGYIHYYATSRLSRPSTVNLGTWEPLNSGHRLASHR
jgi:hypothetical protein